MPLNKVLGNELLDFYGDLLTAKQQDILNLYYREDLSLAEIGEDTGVSRSAVGDLLQRSEKLLTEYEEKLHLVKLYHKRMSIYQKYEKLSDEHIKKMIEELNNLE